MLRTLSRLLLGTEKTVFERHPWLLEYSVNENEPIISFESIKKRSEAYGDFVYIEVLDENGALVDREIAAFDVSSGQAYASKFVEGKLEYAKTFKIEKFTLRKKE